MEEMEIEIEDDFSALDPLTAPQSRPGVPAEGRPAHPGPGLTHGQQSLLALQQLGLVLGEAARPPRPAGVVLLVAVMFLGLVWTERACQWAEGRYRAARGTLSPAPPPSRLVGSYSRYKNKSGTPVRIDSCAGLQK
jgi:hypothetical protein